MKKNLLLILSVSFFNFCFGQETYVEFNDQIALGSSLNDAAECVKRGLNGKNIICGLFENDLDFDPSSSENVIDPLGSPDIFVASYGADNVPDWVFNLGRIGLSDGMAVGGMDVDQEGNILIGGHFSLTVDFDPSDASSNLSSSGGSDAFLAKYDENGGFIWARSIGSSGSESITHLEVNEENQIVVGLRFTEEVDVDPSEEQEVLINPVGGFDAAVIKFAGDGQYQWSEHIEPGTENEIITSLACHQNGSMVIAASVYGTTDGIPEQAMWFGLMDQEGTPQWSYNFDNTGQSNEISHLGFSESGEFLYIGGRVRAVTDFDPASEERIISPLFADPFLAKYQVSDGSLVWAQWIESSSTEDYCAGIIEANGLVYLAGTFDVNAIFVPGDFSSQIASNGDRDMFLSVYDATSGEFIFATNYGGSGSERIRNTDFTESGDLLVAGEFLSSLGLDPESTVPSEGVIDILFGSFQYLNNLSVSSRNKSGELKVYPVPSPEKIFIEMPSHFTGDAEVKIVNVVGQSVLTLEHIEPKKVWTVDISSLNPGIYIVEVEIDGNKFSKRLIKQ